VPDGNMLAVPDEALAECCLNAKSDMQGAAITLLTIGILGDGPYNGEWYVCK